jgi:hypothetical protein
MLTLYQNRKENRRIWENLIENYSLSISQQIRHSETKVCCLYRRKSGVEKGASSKDSFEKYRTMVYAKKAANV